MRLIDADALDMYERLKSYYGDAWRDAQKEIDAQPTVDAVPVIRCKDCKRFDRYTTAPKKYQHDGFCQWWARDTYLDYWCCGAERKEE